MSSFQPSNSMLGFVVPRNMPWFVPCGKDRQARAACAVPRIWISEEVQSSFRGGGGRLEAPLIFPKQPRLHTVCQPIALFLSLRLIHCALRPQHDMIKTKEKNKNVHQGYTETRSRQQYRPKSSVHDRPLPHVRDILLDIQPSAHTLQCRTPLYTLGSDCPS
jgi:hypothetical protein